MRAATASRTVATHSSNVVSPHTIPRPPPPKVKAETGHSLPKLCCCISPLLPKTVCGAACRVAWPTIDSEDRVALAFGQGLRRRVHGRKVMKSAYGRQTPPPDYELTCVEPGSPLGELLRRYWQPVCTSDELRDLPRKEKLLCEELVVFRDKKGRVGALEPHCSHRGTSLEWGRIEEEGLRCCYHGWLYDTQGRCIDMLCEAEEFRNA